MSYFTTTEIDLKRSIGVDSWRLASPLIFHSDLLGGPIEVPAGFVTDFASIPRAFHRLLPKNGTYDAAAVVHDWLYSTGIYHKDTADKIFLEAMKAVGVSPLTRAIMYRAVATFGFAAWNAHRSRP